MPARTLLAAVTLLVASVSPGWGDSCSSGTVLMSASPVSSFQETLWMNAIPGTFGSVSLFGDYSIGSTTFGPFIGTTLRLHLAVPSLVRPNLGGHGNLGSRANL